ncbi:hypothetical protein OIU34_22235 [Pararhizobium sp. BT-229]|uniref:hypothetical protein n=1 Tax=Pararhizobium sp. BT-229 TaxID=2986923 RepID=UPI0021F77AF9|nr:hypothetical protein [Pararhizobium sp. BT-229]MCV9964613.1 hypothetical protein [Pararhizobium sp. BT-229]
MKSVVAETRKPRPATQEQQPEQPPSGKARKISPCAYQTEDEIADYYRNATTGSVAVVRQTQGHMLVYAVTEVEGLNPRVGRVYIKQHGAFYMKSGKNCFHPKGQTTLVVPTEDVLKWAAEHPRGEFDYWTFPPERAVFRG